MLIPLFTIALALLSDAEEGDPPSFEAKLRRALSAVRDWYERKSAAFIRKSHERVRTGSAKQILEVMSAADRLRFARASEIAALSKKAGLPILGSPGVGRVVFDLGDGRALKVAFNDLGRRSNVSEIRYWDENQGTALGEMVFPILLADRKTDLWVVMPKAERLLRPSDWHLPDQRAWMGLARSRKIYGIDPGYYNWGFYQGRWRLLDYGNWERTA